MMGPKKIAPCSAGFSLRLDALFLAQSVFSENQILWFALLQGVYGLGLIVAMIFFPWFLKPRVLRFHEGGP